MGARYGHGHGHGARPHPAAATRLHEPSDRCGGAPPSRAMRVWHPTPMTHDLVSTRPSSGQRCGPRRRFLRACKAAASRCGSSPHGVMLTLCPGLDVAAAWTTDLVSSVPSLALIPGRTTGVWLRVMACPSDESCEPSRGMVTITLPSRASVPGHSCSSDQASFVPVAPCSQAS